jgi:hypothetical protein
MEGWVCSSGRSLIRETLLHLSKKQVSKIKRQELKPYVSASEVVIYTSFVGHFQRRF